MRVGRALIVMGLSVVACAQAPPSPPITRGLVAPSRQYRVPPAIHRQSPGEAKVDPTAAPVTDVSTDPAVGAAFDSIEEQTRALRALRDRLSAPPPPSL